MTKGEKGGKLGVQEKAFSGRRKEAHEVQAMRPKRALGTRLSLNPKLRGEFQLEWSPSLSLFIFSVPLVSLSLLSDLLFSGDMESQNISSEIDDTEYYIMADEGAVV